MIQPWACYVGGATVLAKFLLPSPLHPNLFFVFFFSFLEFPFWKARFPKLLSRLLVSTLQVFPDCGQEGLGRGHWLCSLHLPFIYQQIHMWLRVLLGPLVHGAGSHGSHRGTSVCGWVPNLLLKRETEKEECLMPRHDAEVSSSRGKFSKSLLPFLMNKYYYVFL